MVTIFCGLLIGVVAFVAGVALGAAFMRPSGRRDKRIEQSIPDDVELARETMRVLRILGQSENHKRK